MSTIAQVTGVRDLEYAMARRLHYLRSGVVASRSELCLVEDAYCKSEGKYLA